MSDLCGVLIRMKKRRSGLCAHPAGGSSFYFTKNRRPNLDPAVGQSAKFPRGFRRSSPEQHDVIGNRRCLVCELLHTTFVACLEWEVCDALSHRPFDCRRNPGMALTLWMKNNGGTADNNWLPRSGASYGPIQ